LEEFVSDIDAINIHKWYLFQIELVNLFKLLGAGLSAGFSGKFQ
jgi:hypothetical protein